MPSSAETSSIAIRPSGIHGTGVFALRPFEPGERVLPYVGEIVCKAESSRRCELNNEYIFSLDDTRDIDGNVSWNPARFINHSCEPNCEALVEGGEIWIFAARQIQSGDELTFNYGYDLTDYRSYPCRCGTPGCVGYMVAEEFFSHVRAQAQLDPGKPS